MPGAKFLEGEKTNLRTVEKEDIEFLRDTYNHPDVRKLVGNRRPKNLEQENDFFENVVVEGDSTDLLICVDGEPVGIISLTPQKPEIAVSELGLWLNPEYHGNGYGTEASELMIEYGFDQLNLHKIFTRVFESNEASKHIWDKLGFEKEGHLKDHMYKDGEFEDTLYYGLVKTNRGNE